MDPSLKVLRAEATSVLSFDSQAQVWDTCPSLVPSTESCMCSRYLTGICRLEAKTGAELRRCSVLGSVGRSEGEDVRVPLTAAAQGVAPARDEALSARGCTGAGQSQGGHPGIDDRRRGEFDQQDVIVQSPAAVLGVADDLGCVDELLTTFHNVNVVFTEPHLDAAVEGKHCKDLFVHRPTSHRGFPCSQVGV